MIGRRLGLVLVLTLSVAVTAGALIEGFRLDDRISRERASGDLLNQKQQNGAAGAGEAARRASRVPRRRTGPRLLAVARQRACRRTRAGSHRPPGRRVVGRWQSTLPGSARRARRPEQPRPEGSRRTRAGIDRHRGGRRFLGRHGERGAARVRARRRPDGRSGRARGAPRPVAILAPPRPSGGIRRAAAGRVRPGGWTSSAGPDGRCRGAADGPTDSPTGAVSGGAGAASASASRTD